MKTKMNFKINAMSIETAGGVINTPEIDVTSEIETTILELKGLYELKKTVLEESPEIIEKFAKEFLKAAVSIQKDYDKVLEVVTSERTRAKQTKPEPQAEPEVERNFY